MNTAVIELYALADPVRAASEDDDLFLLRRHGFAFLFISRIEIGGMGLEFSTAGIDPFECHFYPFALSLFPYGSFITPKKLGDLDI